MSNVLLAWESVYTCTCILVQSTAYYSFDQKPRLYMYMGAILVFQHVQIMGFHVD